MEFNAKRNMRLFGHSGYWKAGVKTRLRHAENDVDSIVYDDFGVVRLAGMTDTDTDWPERGRFGPHTDTGDFRDFYKNNRDVFGVELEYTQSLAFLPSSFDGLLVDTNYTYIDSKAHLPSRETAIPLLGQSRHSANASLGYEKYNADNGAPIAAVGTDDGVELARPNGIAVAGNMAFIVERDNARVTVLALPSLQPIGTFGAEHLIRPYGIWIGPADKTGHYPVFITDDDDDNRFRVFARSELRYLGAFASPTVTNTGGIAVTQHTTPHFPEGAMFAVNNDGNVAALDLTHISHAFGYPACHPPSHSTPSDKQVKRE